MTIFPGRIASELALISGSAASVIAQVAPGDMVSEWGRFGVVGILGSICVAMLWCGYKRDARYADTIDGLARELRALNSILRGRPCLRGAKDEGEG